MPPVSAKGVDPIKMLAFERLMQSRAAPLAIRERLRMGASTYYRYLRRYRHAREAAVDR